MPLSLQSVHGFVSKILQSSGDMDYLQLIKNMELTKA